MMQSTAQIEAMRSVILGYTDKNRLDLAGECNYDGVGGETS